MFSLIITIISIALVAALALATLYYGGSAFNRGSAGATASQLINEGQQLNGAVSIAKADIAAGVNTQANLVSELVDFKYLSQLPASFSGSATVDFITPVSPATSVTVTKADIGIDVCKEVEKRAGRTEPADIDSAPATLTGVYGCVKNGTKADFVYTL